MRRRLEVDARGVIVQSMLTKNLRTRGLRWINSFLSAGYYIANCEVHHTRRVRSKPIPPATWGKRSQISSHTDAQFSCHETITLKPPMTCIPSFTISN